MKNKVKNTNQIHKPNFFIVGARKSGTTALYNYLKLHPDIFMPERKEPHFFATDLFYRKLWYKNNIKNYFKLFSHVKQEKRIGEASTCYLRSKTAASEIKKTFPNADIIIMLRNPVDQMYSSYNQAFFNGAETIPNFTEALLAEKDRIKGIIKVNIEDKQRLYYKQVASYYQQVKKYIDTFGKDKIHTIIFDDFKKNTITEYKKTLKFLKVDSSFNLDINIINSKRVRNSSKEPRYIIISILFHFLQSYPILISKIGKLIPIKNKVGIYKYLAKLNTNYTDREPLSSDLRIKLQNEFKPEVDKLSKLINKDLSFWYK